MYFVVFRLQTGEKENAYSLVENKQALDAIPQDIILISKRIKKELYSKESLEKLRDELVSEANGSN